MSKKDNHVVTDPGIDWRTWARELQQQLGSLLADTADLTPEQWARVPEEIRELVQGAIELEAEAPAGHVRAANPDDVATCMTCLVSVSKWS